MTVRKLMDKIIAEAVEKVVVANTEKVTDEKDAEIEQLKIKGGCDYAFTFFMCGKSLHAGSGI